MPTRSTFLLSGPLQFSIERIAPHGDVRTFAEMQMKRHVHQGEPERFDDVIAGYTALGYRWTDGVRAIATWFLDMESAIARIDYLVDYLPERGGVADPIAEGLALLAGLRWHAAAS